MARNEPRGKQLFDEAEGRNISLDAGQPLKRGIASIVAGLRDFFTKPIDGDRAGKSVKGPSAAPGAGDGAAKIPSSTVLAAIAAHKPVLKDVNKALIVVVAALLVFTVFVVAGGRPSLASITSAVEKINYRPLTDGELKNFGTLALYQDQFKTRDIFNEYQEPKPPAPEMVEPVKTDPPPAPLPPKVPIADKAKGLKLVGISWGPTNKVIIKNDRTQEVLFVEEGQIIEGTQIRVKSVAQEKVTLTDGEEEMEME